MPHPPRRPDPLKPRFVSLNEGAAYVGVHPRTLRRAITLGHLTGYRLLGSPMIRLDLAELDALFVKVPPAVDDTAS